MRNPEVSVLGAETETRSKIASADAVGVQTRAMKKAAEAAEAEAAAAAAGVQTRSTTIGSGKPTGAYTRQRHSKTNIFPWKRTRKSTKTQGIDVNESRKKRMSTIEDTRREKRASKYASRRGSGKPVSVSTRRRPNANRRTKLKC